MAVCTMLGERAHAVATTTRPGSILIFPKVVCQDGRDTVLQVTNTGNMPNDFRCFYLNGETCAETNFELTLTRQQPTAWQACAGRRVSPTDPQRGLDPGLIPALPRDYAGALVCAEVDSGDKPIIRNQLKGEATIVDGTAGPTAAAVGKYNAVAVAGVSGNADDTLKLDENEYVACPISSQVNFRREGTDGTVEEFGNGGLCANGVPCNSDNDCGAATPCTTGQSRVTTRVTVVPCNLDFEALTRPDVSLNFEGFDVDESVISGGRRFSCWDSFLINDVVTPPTTAAGSPPFATVTMTGVDPNSVEAEPAPMPVVGVVETFVSDSAGKVASSLTNLHMVGRCDAVKSTDSRARATCTRDRDCGAAAAAGACVLKADAAILLAEP
jgi:hypothetical protein